MKWTLAPPAASGSAENASRPESRPSLSRPSNPGSRIVGCPDESDEILPRLLSMPTTLWPRLAMATACTAPR